MRTIEEIFHVSLRIHGSNRLASKKEKDRDRASSSVSLEGWSLTGPKMIGLQPETIVVISAFDDITGHHFIIKTIEEECVTGFALDVPLADHYGKPSFNRIKSVSTD
jgi:hypothetical protein